VCPDPLAERAVAVHPQGRRVTDVRPNRPDIRRREGDADVGTPVDVFVGVECGQVRRIDREQSPFGRPVREERRVGATGDVEAVDPRRTDERPRAVEQRCDAFRVGRVP
jgi:hypothetical protein